MELKKFLIGLLACLTLGAATVGLAACDEDAATGNSSFSVSTGSSSSSVANSGLPSEGDPTPHTHVYDREVAEEAYLKEAVCNAKAVYYKSCECGKKGTETFVYGDLIQHTYSGGVCSSCGDLKTKGLAFELNGDNTAYSVTGIGACTDTDISIPATYNGLPVTAIVDDAFYLCKSITSVTIPDSVISIGWGAFDSCENLTSVTIGNGVTTIDDFAFYYCTSLTSVTLGNGVTSIGEEAFRYCSSLTSITIPERVISIGSCAFEACYNLTIYCEAESKPSGWHANWNYSNCSVVWGYTGEE